MRIVPEEQNDEPDTVGWWDRAEVAAMGGNAMTTQEQQKLLAEGNRLYETYAKHLEADHWGEYVAISRDGRVVLGEDDMEVFRAAKEAFGPGSFMFKVGDRVMGRFR